MVRGYNSRAEYVIYIIKYIILQWIFFILKKKLFKEEESKDKLIEVSFMDEDGEGDVFMVVDVIFSIMVSGFYILVFLLCLFF